MPIDLSQRDMQARKSASTALQRNRNEHRVRFWFLVLGGGLTLIALNSVSVWGQWSWSGTALASWGITGRILFSISVEALASLFGYMSLLCELEATPSLKFRIYSFASGLAVGLLNYSHKQDVVGIVTGMASFIVPQVWHLWGVMVAYPELKRLGFRNDKVRFAKFSGYAWLFHPLNCLAILHHETAQPHGDATTRAAIDSFNKRKTARIAEKAADRARTEIDNDLRNLDSATL